MSYGWGKPVCGRKVCKNCGRWRLIVDFPAQVRTKRGALVRLATECHTCLRIRLRERKKHDAEFRARIRESHRLSKAAQRREAGIPERMYARKMPYEERRLSNARVREAVEQSGLTWSEVADRLGWVSAGKPDTSRLQRRLGVIPTTGGRGPAKVTKTIRPDIAAAILRAIDVDPVDVGL